MDLLDTIKQAENILQKWRGDSYIFGFDVLKYIGVITKYHNGNSAILIAADYEEKKEYWLTDYLNEIKDSLKKHNIQIMKIVQGATKDAPIKDVNRIRNDINKTNPDIVIGIGGGSTIDAVKVANALFVTGGQVSKYYGKNIFSERLGNRKIKPLITVQTAASSGAENTKTAFVFDPEDEEKKRINDIWLLPATSIFDFRTTINAPMELTLDGAIDSFCHLWEGTLCSVGKSIYNKMEELLIIGFTLILHALPRVLNDPNDLIARRALGLAAGRASHALMYHKINNITGYEEWSGTNCGHFHSYQIPTFATHGRICGILCPYYTVLMARNIELPCLVMAELLEQYGYLNRQSHSIKGRKLALSVAKGLHNFYKKNSFPISLAEIGIPSNAIDKMIKKTLELPPVVLKDMPIPMTKNDVHDYILPTLEAAYIGDLEKVPSKGI